MTRSVVTGAAGFIGSHLCQRLCEMGHDVVGIDSFTGYYSKEVKRRNLESLSKSGGFQFLEGDLATVDWAQLLGNGEYLFHLGAQPGVRASWGADFKTYVKENVLATQTLLEAAKNYPIARLVFASSSSVYGDTEELPTSEGALPQPVSPYGVTKLAGEYLCSAYAVAHDLQAVSLRLFTVYGPRQRPDMAAHRFLAACATGETVTVYGNGEQTRDLTYVADAVDAFVLAAQATAPRRVYNICGGSRISVNELLRVIEEVTGRRMKVQYGSWATGDVHHTFGENKLARDDLGFRPKVNLRQGLERQWESMRLS